MSVEPELPPADFRIAAPGTTMIWGRLDGYKIERGCIGEVEDLLVHYSWEGRPQRIYLFCVGCGSPDVDFDLAADAGACSGALAGPVAGFTGAEESFTRCHGAMIPPTSGLGS